MVVGVPRRTTTLVAAGSLRSRTREVSGISIRTVACSVMRRGPLNTIVQAIVDEQRVGRIPCQTSPGAFRREGAGSSVVARGTRTAVASERLFLEQPAPFLEPHRQAQRFRCAVETGRVAIEADSRRVLAHADGARQRGRGGCDKKKDSDGKGHVGPSQSTHHGISFRVEKRRDTTNLRPVTFCPAVELELNNLLHNASGNPSGAGLAVA